MKLFTSHLMALSCCFLVPNAIVKFGRAENVGVPAQAKMSPLPNYNNWPSIFWRPFLAVILLNNNRRFHLHGALYTAFHYQ